MDGEIIRRIVIVEIWKPVVGYEGYYEVSNWGRVRGVERIIPHSILGSMVKKAKEKVLLENPDGYYTVKLSRDGNDVRVPVHRLVATAFIGPPPEDGMEINHKDFDRKNNTADNLEWVTHQENVQKSYEAGHYVGRNGEDNSNYGNHKLHERYSADKELSQKMQARPGAQNGRACPVKAINAETGETLEFAYMSECARYLIDNGFTRKKTCNPDGVASFISRAAKNGNLCYKHHFELLKQ